MSAYDQPATTRLTRRSVDRRRAHRGNTGDAPVGATSRSVAAAKSTTNSAITGHGQPAAGDDWTGQPREKSLWATSYRARAVATDLAAALIAVAAASLVAFGTKVPSSYVLVATAIVAIWLPALVVAGAYEPRRLVVSDEEYRAVARAFTGMLSTFAVVTLTSQVTVVPSFLLTACALLLVSALAGRFVLRRWLGARRRRGGLMQRAIVVGRADAATALIQSIRSDHRQGLLPVAACASGLETSLDDVSDLDGVPVLGTPADALTAVDLADADVVLLAADPDLSGIALRRLTWALAERDVELVVAPGLLDVAGPRVVVRPSPNLTLMHVEAPEAPVRTALVKGLIDRVVAGLLILASAPLLIAVAIGIRLTSPGKALYRQQRIGLNGQPFMIYKFRTMYDGAHGQLDALREHSDGNAVQFKMKLDPRVTRIGKWLRRYSIDELPQLFNVLFGEMSLVGPRPQTQQEVDSYESDALRRLAVRPGMTGLWQVSGRSDLDWEQSVRLDLRYVDNMSVTSDMRILARTVRAVLAGGGAY